MRNQPGMRGWVAGTSALALAGGLAVGVAAVGGFSRLQQPAATATPARGAIPCGAGWLLDEKIPARLMDGLGTRPFEGLTTKSAEARTFFEQGLALVYGFNHDEARRSFREAARLDPECAMAYWGIAHTLGTNYNDPGAKERNELGTQAIVIAQSLSPRASAMERALIEATAKRFPSPIPDSPETQAAADKAYCEAMRALAKQHAAHDDVQTFYAESMMNLRPWDLWARDGKPHEGTEEILATLERVMERNQRHTGAIHLYIHATEASPHPERSLKWADTLVQLAPKAGHLVHMPSHAYVRTGRWTDALDVNRRAIAADDEYIAATGVKGMYPGMYAPHNVHFLSWAGMLSGDQETAASAATELLSRGSPDMLKEMPQMSMALAWPAMMDARFGKWDRVLAAPEIDSEWAYGRVLRHYTRGLAFVAQGSRPEAERELQSLRDEAKKASPDLLSFGLVNKASDVFRIAELVLAGRIAAMAGDIDHAVSSLTEAVSAEDNLTYMEPADWPTSTRLTLGAVLLEAKRYDEAVRVFREDLVKTPENGWALHGLAAALNGAGDAKGAADAQKRFEKAWAKPGMKPGLAWY